MTIPKAIEKWQYPQTNSGLLIAYCPYCNKQLNYMSNNDIEIVKEYGYETRTVIVKCKCGNTVKYYG
jgi:RNase P subunit RPR2